MAETLPFVRLAQPEAPAPTAAPAPFPTRGLWTVRLVAEYLAVSKRTVWRWVDTRPDFPRPVRLSKTCVRWRPADVRAWAEAHRGAGQQ